MQKCKCEGVSKKGSNVLKRLLMLFLNDDMRDRVLLKVLSKDLKTC
jgi:hypothetical protein